MAALSSGACAFSDNPGLLAFGFTLVTALFVITPLSLAAVTLAEESQAALDWLKHAQQFGIAVLSWVPGFPLVGQRAAAYWQQHVGNLQAANALLRTLSAGSILGWTRSIGGVVAQGSSLFLIMLLALVSLLARGNEIAVQAHVVATRMFGRFGAEFLDPMLAAVRAVVNETVLVSVIEGATIGIGYTVAGFPQPLLFATFTSPWRLCRSAVGWRSA